MSTTTKTNTINTQEENIMKAFNQKVDLRNRKEMINFLTTHFRYYTNNSWNLSTSYANNVKIYNLGLTSEERDKAYELIDLPETYDEFEWLFECFAQDHNYAYQVGFNGRSSGYLVLYQGGREPSDYKSRCTHCGQLNFRTVEETGTRCGKCGEDTRVNLTHPLYKIYTTGASIDQNEDFEDWSIEDIRDRVKLVQDFDRLCDNCLAALKNLINNTEIVDEEYTEVKTRKTLKYKEV